MADENILRTLTLNGKTFTVPEGGGSGGGGDVAFVETTMVRNPPEIFPAGALVYSTESSAAEIKELFDSGKIVYLSPGASEGAIAIGESYFPLLAYNGSGENVHFQGSAVSEANGTVMMLSIDGGDYEGTVYFLMTPYRLQAESADRIPGAFVIDARFTGTESQPALTLEYQNLLDSYVDRLMDGERPTLSYYVTSTQSPDGNEGLYYVNSTRIDLDNNVLYFEDGISLNLSTGAFTFELS